MVETEPDRARAVARDSDRARQVARGYAELYLGLSNYTNNLLDLGYTEADLCGRRFGPA